MTRNPLLKIISICFVSIMITMNAFAELRVEVTKGMMEPLPIAVTDLYGNDASEQSLGQKISTVIMDDLRHTGLFKLLDEKAFLQHPYDLLETPRFEDWRMILAQALVSGRVSAVQGEEEHQKFNITFKLWDVYAQQQMAGVNYTIFEKDWRRAAHKIADVIYNRLTGEEAYFDTRIVYISDKVVGNKRLKRIAIMDQDGANHKYITDDRYLVLTPRFSPNSQKIAYLAYYNNKPRVYVLNLETGLREMVGEFPGMTFAPRFSPDGNHLIMSLAQNGSTDIYEMNLRTKQVERLTKTNYISTSPSYSPDGKQIVFESDRGGSQQVYTMNRDGSNVKRITFGQGRYGNPIWSPRGDLIAFTKLANKQFHIGVIRPDGKGERILVADYHVEGPSWAPNGRTLLYFKEDTNIGRTRTARKSRLYKIDLTGYFEQSVRTPLNGSDPAWSPLLK